MRESRKKEKEIEKNVEEGYSNELENVAGEGTKEKSNV